MLPKSAETVPFFPFKSLFAEKGKLAWACECVGMRGNACGYTGIHRDTQGYTGIHRDTQGEFPFWRSYRHLAVTPAIRRPDPHDDDAIRRRRSPAIHRQCDDRATQHLRQPHGAAGGSAGRAVGHGGRRRGRHRAHRRGENPAGVLAEHHRRRRQRPLQRGAAADGAEHDAVRHRD